ncbi:DUF3617 domain-containing protein [Sphingomonas rosea]|uniref:DUF3617 domain-containing protein n=1 Tax=Sphingomonas rosea TaxID=335605 RepID=UPI0031DD591C
MALTGAAAPGMRALSGVAPGAWEISTSATGSNPRRICFKDMRLVAQLAHGYERCRGTVLRDVPGSLAMDLTCGPGEFGRSEVTVTTPRSLKIETQGIHAGGPFNYTLYARRIGNCRIPTGR